MRLKAYLVDRQGFSLVETIFALSILAFGLLAAGQLLFIAAGSNSLARSKDGAVLAAQSTMESLGDLYRQNPSAAELSLGSHGPRSIEVINPADGIRLNRFNITWVVENVPDPRPGKHINARRLRTAVNPVGDDGSTNSQPGLNKILNLSTIFSQVIR